MQRLHDEVIAVLTEQEGGKKLIDAGFTVIGSSPQELGEFVRTEFSRWDKFTTGTGISLVE